MTNPTLIEEPNAFAALWRLEECPVNFDELMKRACELSGFEEMHREIFINVQHRTKGFIVENRLN